MIMTTYEMIDKIVDLINERDYTVSELAKKLKLSVGILNNLLNMMNQAEIIVIKDDRVELGKLGKIIASI